VRHRQATYSLLDGSPLEIVHHGKSATVDATRPLTRKIPPPPARETPSQPAGRAPARKRAPR
jgi:alpha,alpha-trehalose phosphorylase